MKTFSTGIDIEASPSKVWQVLIDFERWPEWTDTVTQVVSLDALPPGVGSRFLISQPKLRPATWKVTDWQSGHEFCWESRNLGLRAIATHTIDTTPAGCRLVLNLAFTGALGAIVAALAGNMTRQYLAIEAAGLKRKCEAD